MELLNVGGNANNGAQCGVSYANSNNGFSNSRTNIGARLKFYKLTIPTLGWCYIYIHTLFLCQSSRHGMAERQGEHTVEPDFGNIKILKYSGAKTKGVGYEPSGNVRGQQSPLPQVGHES